MWSDWSLERRASRERLARKRKIIAIPKKHHALFKEDRWQSLKMTLVAAFLAVAVVTVLVPTAILTAYLYLSNGLPDATIVGQRKHFQSTLIYDRNGKLLYEMFDPNGGRRTNVRIEEVPPLMIEATIAAEDPTFYENNGVDPVAVARAVLQNFTSGGVSSGASTLTQQLAKNVLFTPEEKLAQTLDRKAKEMIFAMRMTNSYSKDEILELFFNETFYGNLNYGIAAAARNYFGKEVKDLTLAESSLLAGLPQAPSDYDPLRNLPVAKVRQSYVLERMVYHGYISQEEATAAYAEEFKFIDQTYPKLAPHFVDYVIAQLERRYGQNALYTEGWSITTTVDLGLQDIAQRDARKRVDELRSLMNANNAAIVAIRPSTGEVLTMLGSIDYWNSSIQGQVNVANAQRMPGSSIKPFNYVSAYELGYSPNARVTDVISCFEIVPGRGATYCPANFEFKYNGVVMLREALSSSLNVPAVKVLTKVGPEMMAETAHKFGITTFRDPYRSGLTLTLGTSEARPIDMAFAYSTFANGGQMIGAEVPLEERELGYREYEPVTVLKITDPTGKIVYNYSPPAPKTVFSPQASWLITSGLADDNNRRLTYQLGGDLVIDRPSAAKTGTTQFLQDTWTVGFTPDLVTAVWVGNTNGAEMRQVAGLISAGNIWHNFMIDAHKYLNLPPRDFTPPPGVVYGPVCGVDGWSIVGKTPICSAD